MLDMVKKSLRNMTKKAFLVDYEDSSTFPTVAKARQAISRYCEKNGYSCAFTGKDEVTIDGIVYGIYRGYDPASGGNYGIKCKEK